MDVPTSLRPPLPLVIRRRSTRPSLCNPSSGWGGELLTPGLFCSCPAWLVSRWLGRWKQFRDWVGVVKLTMVKILLLVPIPSASPGPRVIVSAGVAARKEAAIYSDLIDRCKRNAGLCIVGPGVFSTIEICRVLLRGGFCAIAILLICQPRSSLALIRFIHARQILGTLTLTLTFTLTLTLTPPSNVDPHLTLTPRESMDAELHGARRSSQQQQPSAEPVQPSRIPRKHNPGKELWKATRTRGTPCRPTNRRTAGWTVVIIKFQMRGISTSSSPGIARGQESIKDHG